MQKLLAKSAQGFSNHHFFVSKMRKFRLVFVKKIWDLMLVVVVSNFNWGLPSSFFLLFHVFVMGRFFLKRVLC